MTNVIDITDDICMNVTYEIFECLEICITKYAELYNRMTEHLIDCYTLIKNKEGIYNEQRDVLIRQVQDQTFQMVCDLVDEGRVQPRVCTCWDNGGGERAS